MMSMRGTGLDDLDDDEDDAASTKSGDTTQAQYTAAENSVMFNQFWSRMGQKLLIQELICVYCQVTMYLWYKNMVEILG